MALGLAMSSDAIAIESLEEHAESSSRKGRAVMAGGIYQCFMAIPVLAISNFSPRARYKVLGAKVFETLEVCAAITSSTVHPLRAAKVLATAARKYGIEAFTLIGHRRHLCGGMGQ